MTQAKTFESEEEMNQWLRQQGNRIRVINTATARKKWSVWTGFLTNAMTFTVSYEDLPSTMLIVEDRSKARKGDGESQSASSEKKKCPFCAELIQREAIKCRFCGSDLTEECASTPSTIRVPDSAKSGMASCKCNACSGEIQFNEDGFDYRNPPTVACPHCGLDTMLYIPPTAKKPRP